MTKILVVDDSQFSRQVMINSLKEAGFNDFLEAENGKEAIDLYKKGNPQLVLMDIIMPKMHGPEAIQKIKEYDEEAKIIVVTVLDQWSSANNQEAEEKSETLGIEGKIKKPIDKEKLINKTKKSLGRE